MPNATEELFADQIAPLHEWKKFAGQIGVTWKGRGYTDAHPVLSSWVTTAHALLPTASLAELLELSRAIQTADGLRAESECYYATLPGKVGEQWRPNPSTRLHTVLRIVRGSEGNHHQYQRDLITCYETLSGGEVIIATFNGLGQMAGSLMRKTPAATAPEEMLELLDEATAAHDNARASLGTSQLWEPCELCGVEPSYIAANGQHLCAMHWD